MTQRSESPGTIACVDAFTDRPFAGNPAAVCRLARPQPGDWMQQLAAEMNLAETAFLEADGTAWALRWFTPRVEVDLCGHATLAAAHVLWTSGAVAGDATIRFRTRSGELRATRTGDAIALDFPAEPIDPLVPPPGLAEALGVRILAAGRNRMDLLVEVGSEEELLAMRPDFAALATFETRGTVVTCRSHRTDADFLSRFFAPRVGIDEDPVTGSAHCALGPYWAARLRRTALTGLQLSARSGVVRVQCRGDRVDLIGRAFTVYSGTLSSDLGAE